MGLAFAVFLGVVLGESDVLPLLLIGAALFCVLFIVGLYRYLWQASLFLIFFDFSYRPFGFTFGALELGCGLGVGVLVMFFWQKRAWKADSPLLQLTSFRPLQRVLFVWLLYVALHLAFNVKFPYRPTDFVFGNAVKPYFAQSAPLALLYFFSRYPSGLTVKKDFFWTICQLCLCCLIIDIGVRFYLLYSGGMYLPIVNAQPGAYTLRTVGPLALTLATVGFTRGNWQPIRVVNYCLLFLGGMVGSIVSGGRVTILIGLVAVSVVLFLRRKVVALGLVLAVTVVGIAVANVFSDWINSSANPHLQRSLQWALFDKKGEMSADIESSSDWRRKLFDRALTEWQSDPRIFWTGRATYGFGVADETAVMIAGGFEALIETSLRRGATHNLISDLLVSYGLIGFIMYAAVAFTLLRLLWAVYKVPNLSLAADNLVLTALVLSGSWIVYAIVGGGFYPAELVWFLIVLIGAFHGGTAIDRQHKGPSEAAWRKLSAPTSPGFVRLLPR